MRRVRRPSSKLVGPLQSSPDRSAEPRETADASHGGGVSFSIVRAAQSRAARPGRSRAVSAKFSASPEPWRTSSRAAATSPRRSSPASPPTAGDRRRRRRGTRTSTTASFGSCARWCSTTRSRISSRACWTRRRAGGRGASPTWCRIVSGCTRWPEGRTCTSTCSACPRSPWSRDSARAACCAARPTTTAPDRRLHRRRLGTSEDASHASPGPRGCRDGRRLRPTKPSVHAPP